ncbi:hypothetical protein R1sor_010434 [Riccia sorocarpa]|uniref:Uncharacterized protein n=1 Tax=Riccia sorocarpa TaxID=122646 RepID=A0ABD3HY40_9MARC
MGQRTLKSKVDREGVEASYETICEGLKLATAGHQKPHAFYEHMKSIFDSYVNHEDDPKVLPLVTSLDAQNFDVEVLMDLEGDTERDAGEAMKPSYLDGLTLSRGNERESSPEGRNLLAAVWSKNQEQKTIRLSPVFTEKFTTELKMQLHEDYMCNRRAFQTPNTLNRPPEALTDLLSHQSQPDPDSPPRSPPNPMELVEPINAITHVVEEPELPCASDLVVVRSTPLNVIDLSQTGLDSFDDDTSTEYDWPKRNDLSKKNIESVQQIQGFLRGDVINCYINEQWLSEIREELSRIYFFNTFWFPTLKLV